MQIISFANISKHYGQEGFQTIALDNVSLTIDSGEFVAITGPSGSGKSTLMHIIGLLDRPSSGIYYLKDEDVSTLSSKKLAQLRLQQIGFVFQSFNLLPRTTALDNVMLPMTYAGLSKREKEKRAIELLERVGLEDRMYHTPAELSGGQMQRVAIARSLANKPPLILADEPTGNLDTKSGQQVLDLLKSLHRDGTTIILVTHDENVSAAAHRSVKVIDGRVETIPTPQEPKKSPKKKSKLAIIKRGRGKKKKSGKK